MENFVTFFVSERPNKEAVNIKTIKFIFLILRWTKN